MNAATTNAFQMAQQQFDQVADQLKLDEQVREYLRWPLREFHVRIPVRMDNGQIRVFNGFFIAQFFIGESGLMPPFPVPFRFIPVAALLSLILALTLTMTGSLYNTWRMAATPAAETMR